MSTLASARKNDASVGVRNRYYCMHELETGITHLRIQHLGGIFLDYFVGPLLGISGGHFRDSFGTRSGQEGAKMGRIWTTVSRF